MWNLLLRLGTVMSTVLIGKQVVDHFWPTQIHPTQLYRPHQLARYLGTTSLRVRHLIDAGDLPAKWVEGEPVVLGAAVLHFLARVD